MYETPSDEIFNEMKEIATSIWNTYDNTYWYVDENLNIINSLENVWDNAMVFYRMFDHINQSKFRNYTWPDTDNYIDKNL